jgi:hypothetical protein
VVEVDIIRTSSSRPDLLKESTESLLKSIVFSGKIVRHIIHEDFINEDLSKKCMDYIFSCGLFNEWRVDNPPIGQAASLTWCFSKSTSPYILSYEDDWVVKEDMNIDLDLVINLMEKNKDINQVCFHKRYIEDSKGDWKKKQIERNGIFLVTNPHWAFQPSLMRSSFLKKNWGISQGSIWKFNDVVKQYRSMPDADWMIENVGAYFLGKIGSGYYLEHIGEGKSIRKGHIK